MPRPSRNVPYLDAFNTSTGKAGAVWRERKGRDRFLVDVLVADGGVFVGAPDGERGVVGACRYPCAVR